MKKANCRRETIMSAVTSNTNRILNGDTKLADYDPATVFSLSDAGEELAEAKALSALVNSYL